MVIAASIKKRKEKVALLVGAWIEIAWTPCEVEKIEVAPLVGAWIEIENIIAKSLENETLLLL